VPRFSWFVVTTGGHDHLARDRELCSRKDAKGEKEDPRGSSWRALRSWRESWPPQGEGFQSWPQVRDSHAKTQRAKRRIPEALLGELCDLGERAGPLGRRIPKLAAGPRFSRKDAKGEKEDPRGSSWRALRSWRESWPPRAKDSKAGRRSEILTQRRKGRKERHERVFLAKKIPPHPKPLRTQRVPGGEGVGRMGPENTSP
jgi:hypothetical protein